MVLPRSIKTWLEQSSALRTLGCVNRKSLAAASGVVSGAKVVSLALPIVSSREQSDETESDDRGDQFDENEDENGESAKNVENDGDQDNTGDYGFDSSESNEDEREGAGEPGQLSMTSIELRYFDGCPNWVEAELLLYQALTVVGLDEIRVELRQVETEDDAVALGFTGSPTILIDGKDPFAIDGSQPGLACRLYVTQAGLRGCPTLEQLVTVLQS